MICPSRFYRLRKLLSQNRLLLWQFLPGRMLLALMLISVSGAGPFWRGLGLEAAEQVSEQAAQPASATQPADVADLFDALPYQARPRVLVLADSNATGIRSAVGWYDTIVQQRPDFDWHFLGGARWLPAQSVSVQAKGKEKKPVAYQGMAEALPDLLLDRVAFDIVLVAFTAELLEEQIRQHKDAAQLGGLAAFQTLEQTLRAQPATAQAQVFVLTPWPIDERQLDRWSRKRFRGAAQHSSDVHQALLSWVKQARSAEAAESEPESPKPDAADAKDLASVAPTSQQILLRPGSLQLIDGYQFGQERMRAGEHLLQGTGFLPHPQQVSAIADWLAQQLPTANADAPSSAWQHIQGAHRQWNAIGQVVERAVNDHVENDAKSHVQINARERAVQGLWLMHSPQQSAVESEPDKLQQIAPESATSPETQCVFPVPSSTLQAGQLDVLVRAVPGTMALLGYYNQPDAIHLRWRPDAQSEPIRVTSGPARWAVLSQHHPDQVQPTERFGVSIGRWRPMPFVHQHQSDNGREIAALLRLNLDMDTVPASGIFELHLPINRELYLVQEVRNNRAVKLRLPTLPAAVPQIWLLGPYDRHWQASQASWAQHAPGRAWLSAPVLHQPVVRAALQQWRSSQDLQPAVAAWLSTFSDSVSLPNQQ